MKNRQLLFILPIICSSHAFASQPIYSYAQSPIHSNVLSLQLRDSNALAPGSFEVKSSYNQASVWAETSDYFLDFYQNQADIAILWQVNSRWKSEVGFKRIVARDNGLDELTHNFHDFFGIGQNGRDEVPQDQFHISIPELGIEINDFEGETLTNALTSYNEYRFYSDTNHSLSAGFSIYFNFVNSGPFKRDSFEQGVQINYSFRNEKHTFHSMLGVVNRSSSDIPNELLTKQAGMWAVGYNYAFNNKHSVIIESHNYSGWAESNDDFSEPSNEVVLGYRYSLERVALDFSMSENARNMDNSTDIAFTIGLRFII